MRTIMFAAFLTMLMFFCFGCEKAKKAETVNQPVQSEQKKEEPKIKQGKIEGLVAFTHGMFIVQDKILVMSGDSKAKIERAAENGYSVRLQGNLYKCPKEVAEGEECFEPMVVEVSPR